MSPSVALQFEQERIAQNDAAFCDWATMGAEDAQAVKAPKYVNDAYIAGYVRAIKELPLKFDGAIARMQHQNFGHFDEF